MGRARALARYSATRLALAPLMLWLIATLVFLLLRVAPGDPVDAVLGSRAPAAAKAAMRARLGLDQSKLKLDPVQAETGSSLSFDWIQSKLGLKPV